MSGKVKSRKPQPLSLVKFILLHTLPSMKMIQIKGLHSTIGMGGLQELQVVSELTQALALGRTRNIDPLVLDPGMPFFVVGAYYSSHIGPGPATMALVAGAFITFFLIDRDRS